MTSRLHETLEGLETLASSEYDPAKSPETLYLQRKGPSKRTVGAINSALTIELEVTIVVETGVSL